MSFTKLQNKTRALIFATISLIVMLLPGCRETPASPDTTSLATPTSAAAGEPTASPGKITEMAVEPADSAADSTAGGEMLNDASALALSLVDTFEAVLLQNGRAGLAEIGYVIWSDGSPVSIETVTLAAGSELARPAQEGDNTVLQLNTDVGLSGWAGFSHAFANAGLDQWLTQDWSAYEGISLWLYGTGSGGTLFVDILDNRNPNSEVDDAERWSHDIPDDFHGWRYFEIPFEQFRRKDIGNGAPTDGFTYTEIHGYAIGVFGSVDMGADPIYVDEVSLYGVAPERPVEISLLKNVYSLRENGTTTIRLNLNKPAEEPLTVYYETSEGAARPGQDFILEGDMVTFAPGEMAQAFRLEAVDDTLAEGDEQTLILLSRPSAGAVLNPQSRAVLTIRDNESLPPGLIDSFNQPPPFLASPGTILSIAEIDADSDQALPGQAGTEQVLQVTAAAAATMERRFAAGQDWSGETGLTFWFYGQNSGAPVTLELLSGRAATTAELPPDAWSLVWSDEFDDPAGTPPDPGAWQPEIGDGLLNGVPGWGNGELEYYTGLPENAATDGQGSLVISALPVDGETTKLRCWYGPCEYTSARLITWGRVEQEFGRIEARLKLPQGQGLWPAFWMLGTNLEEVGWPQSGEIDIMENIGREPSTIHGSLHGPGYSGGQNVGASYTLETGSVADDFHVYAVEWTPDSVRWFVDEFNYSTITAADIPAGAEWAYNHPFFIILNVAVGGNWPGLPDETTRFPQRMWVDYVRIYGAPDNSTRFAAGFLDDFSGWREISLPFSAFDRADVQPEGAPDSVLDLGQIWGYTVQLPGGQAPYFLEQLQFEETSP